MIDESPDESNAFFQSMMFTSFIFKLRTKVEFYGDTSRNKVTAQSVGPVNHKDYNDHLVKSIERLTGIGKH